ncbi:MAG: hypothetical protein OEM79_07670 [Nitrosopumilus sp.]|nr:hypothetical protein [Nitrosopumilus sp.]
MNWLISGVIITLGIFALGVIYLASFDEESEKTLQDITIIDALNNIEFGKDRDNDTHYERVDREKKYYASMVDIKLIDDDSIRITFDANSFEFGRDVAYVEPESSSNTEFVSIIHENQTFVAGCNSHSLRGASTEERIQVKQIHILKYIGITEKDGVDYYGFVHEAGYISDELECEFSEMIQHSLDIDFDISKETNYYGEVWDNNWT